MNYKLFKIKKPITQGIGFILCITGIAKTLNWAAFIWVVSTNTNIPAPFIEMVLQIAISIEIVLGLLAIIHPNLKFLIQYLIAILTVFAVYNIWVLSQGGKSCGCLIGTGFSAGPHLMLILDLGAIACLAFARRLKDSPCSGSDQP